MPYKIEPLADGTYQIEDEIGTVIDHLSSRAEAVRIRAELIEDLEQEPERSIEDCPGCGAAPGQGLASSCSHPLGCGFWRAAADDAYDRLAK